MRFFSLIFLLLLTACIPGNKSFICGDRECVNKKERDQFFSEKLIVEIINKDNFIESTNLVKLNKKNNYEKNKNIFKQKFKLLSKDEKKIIKKKIKNKKINESKKNISKSKKITLDSLTPNKRETKIDLTKNIISVQTKNECKIIELCDINKIEKNVMKKGLERKFPNITSK